MHELRQELLKQLPDHEVNLVLFHLLRKTQPTIRNFSDLSLFSGEIDESIQAEALRIAGLRAQGIPLQHLLGTQFFLNHDYFVDASTLIPRPETEVLANEILKYAETRFKRVHSFRFAELGLGSGILSTELLSAFSGASGVATELSFSAITLAERNLQAIVGQAWSSRFIIQAAADPLQGFEALISRGPYDLIFSNPPYVANEDEIESQVLEHEPATALYPMNRDPNFFYENFILHASQILSKEGAAFFEVPHERAAVILDRFVQSGFKNSVLIHDLTDRPRVLKVKS